MENIIVSPSVFKEDILSKEDSLEAMRDFETKEIITDPFTGLPKRTLNANYRQLWFRLTYPEGCFELAQIKSANSSKVGVASYYDGVGTFNEGRGNLLCRAFGSDEWEKGISHSVRMTSENRAMTNALKLMGFILEEEFLNDDDAKKMRGETLSVKNLRSYLREFKTDVEVGKKRLFLPHEIRLAWFREKFPQGRIICEYGGETVDKYSKEVICKIYDGGKLLCSLSGDAQTSEGNSAATRAENRAVRKALILGAGLTLAEEFLSDDVDDDGNAGVKDLLSKIGETSSPLSGMAARVAEKERAMSA
jgi:hypothetical protein